MHIMYYDEVTPGSLLEMHYGVILWTRKNSVCKKPQECPSENEETNKFNLNESQEMQKRRHLSSSREGDLENILTFLDGGIKNIKKIIAFGIFFNLVSSNST